MGSQTLQDEFVNGIDRMNKIAYSLVHGNAKAWASKAERKGILTISEKIEIEDLVNLRNTISHGNAGKVFITNRELNAINRYIRIMNNTVDRFRRSGVNDMPPGAFRGNFSDDRSYGHSRSYIKRLTLNDFSGRQYNFKFQIVYEYQTRAFDDGVRFSGDGYTIYVLEAPYREWCLENNEKYEFHFYAAPRGSESVCWNALIQTFEDANKIMYVWAKRYMKILSNLLDNHVINTNRYDQRQRNKFSMPTGTFRNRQMKFTKEVYNKIRITIGKIKPEQGGILGIGNDSDVVDFFVHDKHASVGYAEYNPNVKFLNKVINTSWKISNIDFCGFVHSHPSKSTMLSNADIEYAIEIMKEFDLAYLYMPLVNSSADGKFKMHGYYVHKNGDVERCKIVIEDEEKNDELPIDDKPSNLKEDEIMNFFETSKAKPINVNKENQYDRIDSCLPLTYLNDCVIIGIGCGGAREFYIDMARMGVMNFILMDGDDVSLTNISSQNVYLSEIGKKKVDIICDKLKQINEKINVDKYAFMLNDDIDDEWVEKNWLNKYKDKNIVLCAFTDNFFAQARVSNIAVKYKIPLITAQHHKYGETSEIVYWYPEVSIATPKSILALRYNEYEKGFKNDVTSEGSPIFNTVRLNALCEKIVIGMLLYNHNKYHQYSNFLVCKPESNLILIRQNSLIGSTSTFVSTFENNKDSMFDDPIWISVEKEEIYEVVDTRKIFKSSEKKEKNNEKEKE